MTTAEIHHLFAMIDWAMLPLLIVAAWLLHSLETERK